jgi:hypothetical protein
MQPLVVRVPDHDPPTVFEFAVPPEPDLRAQDIDERSVLLCNEVDCQLYTVTETGSVEALAGARLAKDRARGVVEWRWREMPCVFGSGLSCFDRGSWLELVPASGASFHAAAATRTSLWAAGEQGRIVAATTECWIELPSGTDATLRSLSADGSRELWATVAAHDGTLAYVTLDETLTCIVPGASWKIVHRTWGENWGYGVAHHYDWQWLFGTDGTVIEGKPSDGGGWCTQTIGDEVRDVTTSDCGISENHRVVTPTDLFGTQGCAID